MPSRGWVNRAGSMVPVRAWLTGALLVGWLTGPAWGGERWWPRFRGPDGNGVAADARIPTGFGPQSNVVWQIPVTGGNGSPCIWENHLFLTAASEGRLLTIALDRRTGRELWRRELQPDQTETHSGLGSLANATPATDGERVCVYFGSFGLVAYDFAGSELWRHPLPVPVTQHGAGTSPVLAGERLLLVCDQDVGSFVLALDKRTGRVAWKTDRSTARRGFSTPLPFPPSDPQLAIVTGTLRLAAYQLSDGAERWSVHGLPNEMVASPVTDGTTVYAAGWTHGSGPARLGSYDALLAQADGNHDGKIARAEATSGPARQHFAYIDADKDESISRGEWESMATIFDRAKNVALAVRPDGRGDVTETHVLWRFDRGLPYVPSPLVYRQRVYLVKDGGMLTCLDATTGAAMYREERLGAQGNYYASPVAAGGKICVISQRGECVIIQPADTLVVLARNAMGEEVLATPAIVGDRLYLRTKTRLYAFGAL